MDVSKVAHCTSNDSFRLANSAPLEILLRLQAQKAIQKRLIAAKTLLLSKKQSMPPARVDIAQFLTERRERALLDVRTPAEYEAGHIPGALNLPLFSNEERAEVGTLYKQVSPRAAFLRGLELAGARMRSYVEQALAMAPHGRIAMYCWRGGQRSGSMAWLLDTAGMDVVTLQGGYKAWRQHVFEQMAQCPAQFIVLGGQTGAGKTRILHALREAGQQILDLEALANHKGSAFGSLGEAPQPTHEHFTNLLYDALFALDFSRRIWVESESKAIGKVQIPNELWRHICAAPMIEIQIPLEQRLANLVVLYGAYPKAQLAEAFRRIAKRLGGLRLHQALEALEANDYAQAATIALEYYDKAYQLSLSAMNRGQHWSLTPDSTEPTEIARQLLELNLTPNICPQ